MDYLQQENVNQMTANPVPVKGMGIPGRQEELPFHSAAHGVFIITDASLLGVKSLESSN
jgi:hypothetical protein